MCVCVFCVCVCVSFFLVNQCETGAHKKTAGFSITHTKPTHTHTHTHTHTLPCLFPSSALSIRPPPQSPFPPLLHLHSLSSTFLPLGLFFPPSFPPSIHLSERISKH